MISAGKEAMLVVASKSCLRLSKDTGKHFSSLRVVMLIGALSNVQAGICRCSHRVN